MRAKPYRGTASGIKPEKSFSALSPLSPTVGCFASHSHPSPPEKKAASRKKSRLRRKKTAPDAKNGASCVSRVINPYLWILATTDPLVPPRLNPLTLAGSKLRFRLRLRLHGVVHDTPSPMAGFIFVARHKSGESYPFLNERAVLQWVEKKGAW